MRLQVTREMLNPLGQQRNLYFSRAGITFMNPVLLLDRLLYCGFHIPRQDPSVLLSCLFLFLTFWFGGNIQEWD